jgi:hypothetical protein
MPSRCATGLPDHDERRQQPSAQHGEHQPATDVIGDDHQEQRRCQDRRGAGGWVLARRQDHQVDGDQAGAGQALQRVTLVERKVVANGGSGPGARLPPCRPRRRGRSRRRARSERPRPSAGPARSCPPSAARSSATRQTVPTRAAARPSARERRSHPSRVSTHIVAVTRPRRIGTPSRAQRHRSRSCDGEPQPRRTANRIAQQ